MDAKRMVPVLHVLEGRVVDPVDGSVLGLPTLWARRLEMEGADEILFVERGRGRRLRQAWLTETARTVFIPLVLEAPFEDEVEVAEALADGADKIVIPVADLPGFVSPRYGRTRIVAAVGAGGAPVHGWNEFHRGGLDAAHAGELLLTAEGDDVGALCARIARFSIPLVLRCADPVLAGEALGHGADGIAFPAGRRTSAAFKALLGSGSVPIRR